MQQLGLFLFNSLSSGRQVKDVKQINSDILFNESLE